MNIYTIYNICAIYQSSYAEIVRTVVSHLSEWLSSCLDLKAGASVVIVINGYLTLKRPGTL